jgi:hypothetical protein
VRLLAQLVTSSLCTSMKSVRKRFKWGMAKSIVIGFYSLFTSVLVWKVLLLHPLISPPWFNQVLKDLYARSHPGLSANHSPYCQIYNTMICRESCLIYQRHNPGLHDCSEGIVRSIMMANYNTEYYAYTLKRHWLVECSCRLTEYTHPL